MKIFKLLGMAILAIVMSVGFIACSSDDDNYQEETGNNISKTIIGQWKSERIETSVDETTFDTSDKTLNGELFMYFTFNNDGTGHEIMADTNSKSDYTFEIIDGYLYTHYTTTSWKYKIIKSSKDVIFLARVRQEWYGETTWYYCKLVRI